MDKDRLSSLLIELKQEYDIENAAVFKEYGAILASLLQDKNDKETFGITMATAFSAAETAMEEANGAVKRVIVESNNANWIVSRATSKILVGITVKEN